MSTKPINIKVVHVKAWCTTNLSPVAWTRIIIKTLNKLNKLGYGLNELDKPAEDEFFDIEAIKVIDDTCFKLYNINLPYLELVSN